MEKGQRGLCSLLPRAAGTGKPVGLAASGGVQACAASCVLMGSFKAKVGLSVCRLGIRKRFAGSQYGGKVDLCC